MGRELGIFIICRKGAWESLSIVLPLPTSHHCMLFSCLDLACHQCHAPFPHKDFHSFSDAAPMPGTSSLILYIIQSLDMSTLPMNSLGWPISADSGLQAPL